MKGEHGYLQGRGRDCCSGRWTQGFCLCALYPALVIFGVLLLYNSGYMGQSPSTAALVPAALAPGQSPPGYHPESPASPLQPATITKGLPRAQTAWSWLDIFSFVPNGLRHCPDLFPKVDKTSPFPEPFRKEYEVFKAKLVSVGDINEGTSAAYIEEYIAYYHIVQAPFIRTVCETGFNGGHSSFMWLQANPNTTVYSFDIGEHRYSRPMADYLQQRFPGRLTVTWGDSTKTLPAFRKANPAVKCDVISIDGGHTNPVCLSDYNNFRQMASLDNIILLDNYPDTRLGWMQKLGDVWESAKREGQIIEIFQCNYEPKVPQGFSVGRLNPYFIT